MTRLRLLATVLTLACGCPWRASADDWPQWRGPSRNGISREVDGLAGWSQEQAPAVAWRAAVGKGHAGVSVAAGRAYTMGWDGTQDSIFCFDAASGESLWRQTYPCSTILQWPGPRATPTVHQNVVYTLGQHGQLRAWDAGTGRPLWQRDLPEDYNPDVDYGFAWSPLIADNLLILNAGSHGLAIRLQDGSIAWGDDRQKSACVSAVPYTHQGVRGVLVVSLNSDRSAASLVGVEPLTGRQLWRYDGWQEKWGAMGVDPIVHEGHVFLTSAEQFRQGARFTITGSTLRQDWTTHRIAGYTGAAVLLGGHLYLVDGAGILKCVAWESGEVQWQQRGFDDRGTLIAVDKRLILQAGASGEVTVAAADPTAYRQLRRTTVFQAEPHTFTAPVLANGRLYCRSYQGEVVCLATGAASR